MRLQSFTIEHNGDAYTYAPDTMVWHVNGKSVYSKNVPNAVKQAREVIIDAVSNISLQTLRS